MLLLYPMMANFLIMGCALPFVYRAMPAVDLGGLIADGLPRLSSAALCHIAAYRAGSAVVVAPMQYSQILWAVLYGARVLRRAPGLEHGDRRRDHHPLGHLRRPPRGPRRLLEEPPGARDPQPLRHRHLPPHQLGVPAVPQGAVVRDGSGRSPDPQIPDQFFLQFLSSSSHFFFF